MLALLVNWVVTALLFLVLARLPIGVRIDGFGTALLAALVFGTLNTFLKPVLTLLTLPLTILTLGLFLIVLNAALFALSAALVPGFRLTHGFLSAVLGSLAISFLSWLVQVVFWSRPSGG
jgi:putative membrane protein